MWRLNIVIDDATQKAREMFFFSRGEDGIGGHDKRGKKEDGIAKNSTQRKLDGAGASEFLEG